MTLVGSGILSGAWRGRFWRNMHVDETPLPPWMHHSGRGAAAVNEKAPAAVPCGKQAASERKKRPAANLGAGRGIQKGSDTVIATSLSQQLQVLVLVARHLLSHQNRFHEDPGLACGDSH